MPDDTKAQAGRTKKTTGAATGSGRAVRPSRGAAVAGAKPKAAKTLTVIEGGASPEPVKGGTLRKKELVERVVAVSGAKKKLVKDVVEATLKVLGDALAADESLALPPFGKAKVNRHKDLSSGEMLVVKLRRGGPVKPGAEAPTDALAEDAE